LLVQEFPVVSVHFEVPILVDRKRSKTAAVSLTVAEGTLGSLIGDANPLFNDGVAINSKR
jgi:hypothetical protein